MNPRTRFSANTTPPCLVRYFNVFSQIAFINCSFFIAGADQSGYIQGHLAVQMPNHRYEVLSFIGHVKELCAMI